MAVQQVGKGDMKMDPKIRLILANEAADAFEPISTALQRFSPDYVILYEKDLPVVRQVELYACCRVSLALLSLSSCDSLIYSRKCFLVKY